MRYHSVPKSEEGSSLKKNKSASVQSDPVSHKDRKHNKTKFKGKDEITEEEEFDPYKGEPNVPIETIQKYQRGKRIDFVSLKNPILFLQSDMEHTNSYFLAPKMKYISCVLWSFYTSVLSSRKM